MKINKTAAVFAAAMILSFAAFAQHDRETRSRRRIVLGVCGSVKHTLWH